MALKGLIWLHYSRLSPLKPSNKLLVQFCILICVMYYKNIICVRLWSLKMADNK